MAVIGGITKLDRFMTRGWAVDTESARPVSVEVRIGSVPIKTLRPVLKDPAFNGIVEHNLVGFQFFFTEHLLEYVGANQPIEFFANGVRLHVGKHRLGVNRSPRPVAELKTFLDDGGIVTKKGEIRKSIHIDTEWQTRVFRQYDHARTVFRRLFGKDLYVVGGTLLGLVREGGFISGDDDFDTSYLSSHHHWRDVRRELVEIATALVAAGENVEIMEGQALIKWRCENGVIVEVFPSWIEGPRYYLVFGVGEPIAHAIAQGFEERQMAGHNVLAPIASEALLQATYGPGWRIPDPTFQWIIPRHIRDVMEAVKPNDVERAQVRWSRRNHALAAAGAPSAFADHVAEDWVAAPIAGVLDVGCGQGRDTLRIARGLPALGLDHSPSAIDACRKRWGESEQFGFAIADVRDVERCREVCQAFSAKTAGPLLLYARFLLDAIDDPAEERFCDFARGVLPPRSILAIEFRADPDGDRKSIVIDRYGRLVNMKTLIKRVLETERFELLHEERGSDLPEDAEPGALIGRLVFRRIAAQVAAPAPKPRLRIAARRVTRYFRRGDGGRD